MTYKVASLAAFAVPAFTTKGAVIVSSASDLKNWVLSKLSKVAALTLLKFAPDPLNPPVAVTDPAIVRLPF